MAESRPAMNWAAFGSLASLGLALFGGLYAVEQTQITSISKEIDIARNIAEARALLIQHEQERREIEIKSALKTIQEELDRRRDEFVQQRQFRQFEDQNKDNHNAVDRRAAAADKRLDVLEQTRPTNGVLEAISKALEERLRALEARKPAEKP